MLAVSIGFNFTAFIATCDNNTVCAFDGKVFFNARITRFSYSLRAGY
jgi:hypothetical protein